MKAIITGITGQDGSYLAELLLSRGYEVFGVIRRSSTPNTSRIKHLINNKNLKLICGDVTDFSSMSGVIKNIKPDELYNLAAQSHVGESFKQPYFTFDVDAIGVLNILESIRLFSPTTRFYQASTSELFGNTPAPQNEDTPMSPESPYAVAKLAAHKLVSLYRRAYNIFACCGILFNHEGPRRGEEFVTRKITKYVAKLMKVKRQLRLDRPIPNLHIDTLKLGNLFAKRDWSHAKDMVYGMWLMLQQDVPEDYVLGSGVSRSVEDFLKAAFSYAQLNHKDYVEIDPQFYRPLDVNYLMADTKKANNRLGWKQQISFEQMVHEMVEHDLQCQD